MMMNKLMIAGLLLVLLPAAWAQGGQTRAEKIQRQVAAHREFKEAKPPQAPQQPQPSQREVQAQRRAELRAALLAKRPPEQVDDNKHLTPREKIELRQQLRQQQQRSQDKG
jgi:hypothetical protein